MTEYPKAKFHIEGHTDSTGSEATNSKLSEGRAAAVKNYLIANGIDGNRLTSKGYGESVPIASNKTRSGRRQNRRVEIKVVNPE
jgi:outer membrane protein OmpA-like peptidoglycan-associated protein